MVQSVTLGFKQAAIVEYNIHVYISICKWSIIDIKHYLTILQHSVLH